MFCIAVVVVLLIAGSVLFRKTPSPERARTAKTRWMLEQIGTALDENYLMTGIYPTNFAAVPISHEIRKQHSMVNGQPTDAWGQPLVYVSYVTNFSLSSAGADGKRGTDDDIQLSRR